MARLEESYQQGLATVRRKNNAVHSSRLVFSTFCECQEKLEAEWTQLFLSTSLEESLKTYAMSLVCHAFLHETPPIADVGMSIFVMMLPPQRLTVRLSLACHEFGFNYPFRIFLYDVILVLEFVFNSSRHLIFWGHCQIPIRVDKSTSPSGQNMNCPLLTALPSGQE